MQQEFSTSGPSPSSQRLIETTAFIERLVVLGVLAGLMVGVFQILRPFLTAILFGSILVIATWPVREWLVRRTHSACLATVLLLLTTLAVIGIPAILLTPNLVEQFVTVTTRVQTYLSTAPAPPNWADRIPFIKDRVPPLWEELIRTKGNLLEILKPYSTELRQFLLMVAQAFAQGVLDFFLSLAVAMMFWLRGEALAKTLNEVGARLAGSVAGRALSAAADSVRGVAYGILGTAAIQAVVLAAGLYFAGIPEARILGFVSFLIAISQLGVLLVVVWGGAAVWLFAADQPFWGAFMIAWGLLVSTGDNLIRPWLMSVGSPLPLTLVFLGVFGGFFAFGFLGMFIGPTLLGVSFTLLQAWRERPLTATDLAAEESDRISGS